MKTMARSLMRTGAGALTVAEFWLLAAGFVAAIRYWIWSLSPTAGVILSIAALMTVSLLYTRTFASEHGLRHSMAVGTAWLLMSVAVELFLHGNAVPAWDLLLGPAHTPAVRTLLSLVWIGAPALFARRCGTEGGS